jgi:hypothetical protein
MKKYIPHTFITFTSFIAAASVEAGQMFFFLSLTIAGLVYLYRDEIQRHMRR